ncbi:hypothetical protein AHAS_Ahas13G0297000 [Arachis hypogaea]
MGVARQTLGVPHQKGTHTRCATWYRRRGTPTLTQHLGVPLEDLVQVSRGGGEGLHTWACHLISKAWHTSYHS